MHGARAGLWPEQHPYQHLAGFLGYIPQPLSQKALAGFLLRAARSPLRLPAGLLEAVSLQLADGAAY